MSRKTAMKRMPKEVAKERLSPGVYRGNRGGLVTQSGRQIQNQSQSPVAQPAQPTAPQNEQSPGQQVNRQFPMSQYPSYPRLQSMPDQMGNSDNFNFSAISKTPPPWPFGQRPMMMPFAPSSNMPQMPEPSANMGGQYRLSPGVYGNQNQAMNQYNQQMQSMYQPINGLGQQGNTTPMDWNNLVSGYERAKPGNMPLIDSNSLGSIAPYGQYSYAQRKG
jgi:hypothetical protein